MTASKRTLANNTIRQWVGDEGFRRGERYYRDGMIIHARRTGTLLKAESHGSGGSLYRVQATIAGGQIISADCSCPVGDGGHCKHIAALLLTWLNQPDDFQEVEDTNTALERRSKEEMIALVKQMLARVPELETLFEVPLPTGKKSRQKVNSEIYRRQVAAAFRGLDYEYGIEDTIAQQIRATLAIGDGFVEQGDLANAHAVYEAVIHEVLEHYGEFSDEGGDLGSVVQDAVAGLGRCLEADAERGETELRGKILRALFEVYRFDVNFGGVGLSDGVTDLILQHADGAEKRRVADWVRAAMKTRAESEWGTHWGRQAYGGFLLELQADELDDEAYLRVCRESHRLNDLVERLLTLNRVDEAIKETESADDYEMLNLADIFVEHEQVQVAEQLMTERAKTTQDARIFDWLKERREKQGDFAGALLWAAKSNMVRPSLEQYREIRKLAQAAGTWADVRPELLADLDKRKEFGLLTQIHLDENEIDAAFETLENSQRAFPYALSDLRLQVAQAAEATRPRDALRIYLQAAEQIVKARNRGAYADACQYLVRVRALYQKLGEDAVWEQYLRKLKEETKAMRAFKEEMAQARL
jgi:uncharacterized Zn finger protein